MFISKAHDLEQTLYESALTRGILGIWRRSSGPREETVTVQYPEGVVQTRFKNDGSEQEIGGRLEIRQGREAGRPMRKTYFIADDKKETLLNDERI